MNVHEEWLKKIQTYKEEVLKATGFSMQLPPPTLAELQLEYLEIIPGEKMRAKLPFQQRFTNPAGVYQGGFLGAAIDEVFGPLSYVTSQTICMTLSMNLTFLKPFTVKMGHVEINAMVLQKTRNFIFMRAEVLSPRGDLLAHSEAHVAIMTEEQLRKKA